jgi:hypothetical protein
MDIKEFSILNPYLPVLEQMANGETYYAKTTGKLPLSKKQMKARAKSKASRKARKK